MTRWCNRWVGRWVSLLCLAIPGLLPVSARAAQTDLGAIEAVRIATEAFRNTDTDWQLWVEVGASPIPRKMVITSKTLNSAPQYTLRIKSWKTNVEPAPDAFSFVPPPNAQRLSPDTLIGLDELPPETSTGAKQ